MEYIQLEEIRVGNFFHFYKPGVEEKEGLIVRGIYFDFDYGGYVVQNDQHSPIGIKGLMGIEITEECLISFGCFKSMSFESKTYLNIDVLTFKNDYGGCFLWEDNELWLVDCDDGKMGEQIKYVHELQNLFFDLKKESLKYK